MKRFIPIFLSLLMAVPSRGADITLPVDTPVTVPVNKLPLIDSVDFVTLESAVAYNAGGLVLEWNFTDATGATSQTAVSPTNTGGDYDWTNNGSGMYEIEIPASGGGSINNNQAGTGWFTFKADGVLCAAGPTIQFVPGNVVNSLVAGTDKLEVDVNQLGGSAQLATDLKDFADAGYDPDTDKVQGVVLTDATTTVSNRVTADVDRVDGAALDTHDAGAFPADVRSIQGNATSASNLNELTDGDATGAPLQITELAVTEGATISTTDSGEPALTLAGNGGGLVINAGSAGTGVTITGGTSGGFGVELTTTDGHGVIVSAGGNNATGVSINGGTGLAPVGLKISGGAGLAPVDIDADILGSITGDLIGNVSGSTDSVTSPVTVGTNNDKTGYSLSQAGLADFFDTNTALTFANAVSGSVVKEIADHATTPSLTAGGIADAVLDEPLSGHPTTGSLGAVVADIFDFLDGAPTFAEAMNGHGYTTGRAQKIDRLAPTLLLSTTIDGMPSSQTTFVLDTGPSDNGALNGSLVIITDGADPAEKAVGLVKSYVGLTRTVTLVTDPGIFTISADDEVDVIAAGASAPLWLSGP